MTLGIVIVDTFADKRCALFAVEQTLRALAVDEVLELSDRPFIPGARHVPIAVLRGIEDYNALMLDRMCEHINCDAYLVVQWDGFALDGRRWQSPFLEFDYVGAPWLHLNGTVGSGGFSLRSKALVRAVCALRRGRQGEISTPEDVQICFQYRNTLETRGLRFASTQIGGQFSFERHTEPPSSGDPPPTFGFHGAFNFPLVLTEAQILDLFESITARMNPRASVWALFVWHAWLRGYQTLVRRTLTELGESDAVRWGKVVRACLAWGMPREMLRSAT